MNKFWKIITVGALASAVLFTSCKKDEEEDPTPDPTVSCADKTNEIVSTGDATINVLNFSGTTIEVEAGKTLSMAVEVIRGSERAKKLRLWQSDCINTLGTEVDLSSEPKGGKNGIDLRRTDDPQVRNFNYMVPTGMDPLYLTIEITEGGDLVVYKQLTLDVSGSGVISSYTGIELGGNTNAAPSRMFSGTGETYTACNAAANINYIDITHAVGTPDGGTTYNSYICSNPARFQSPISLTNSNPDCGEDTDLSTAGGTATYFKESTADFDAATDSELSALTVSSSDMQYVVAAVGGVYEFMNADGHKGLIKVTGEDSSFGLGDGRGSMTVSVKVTR